MNWFSFLMSSVGPLAIRVLLSLGIATLTFTGVTASLDTLISQLQNNWNNIPVACLAILSLAGAPQAVGLILGAMSSRVSMWVASSATRWIVGK